MNARRSAPRFSFVSLNFLTISSYASSHVDSLNSLPSRINGLVKRSPELTKSQPNLPLTHVEIWLAGASELGSTLRTSRPFVHTSNEHPTPQYVHTVFVFLMRSSRISASTSEIAINGVYPVSTDLVNSTAGRKASLNIPVRKPASPSIFTSIIALHGQTVEQ